MMKISEKQILNSITIAYFNKLEIYCLKISLRKLENNKGQLKTLKLANSSILHSSYPNPLVRGKTPLELN